MKTLNPYLSFGGNALEAINFYKDVLQGEIVSVQTYGEVIPDIGDTDKNRVMHAEVKAGDMVFFASDGPPGHVADSGNMVSMTINLDDTAEQERIFKGLSAGGTVTMELNDTFWGARFGQLVDKFGIPWLLNCDLKK